MTETLPEPPELDPAALASSDFTRSRRGLEATEVRTTLGRAADALRAWELRDDMLRQRIVELEDRLSESHELDERRIATVLGEETARIVTAARDAASEIRAKAEEEAERLRNEIEERATAAAEALASETQALRDEAARVRDEAAGDATAVREVASEDAARLRDEAVAEVAALREEVAADTAAVREEAAALATTTVSDAQIRRDELLNEADAVLSVRTAEAEEAAAEIAAAAAALLAEAEQDASALLEKARSEADEAVALAEAQAASTVQAARDKGRAMVAEAREVRERMLGDLASRRRIARRQIEGALAGRDRVMEIMVAAAEQVGVTIDELERIDDEATAAAESAAAAVEDDWADVAAPVDADDGPVDAGSAAVEAVATEWVEADDESSHSDASESVSDDREDGGATVHDLFARIRAQGLDEDDDEDAIDDDPGDDAESSAAPEVTEPVDDAEIDLTDADVDAGDEVDAPGARADASGTELASDPTDPMSVEAIFDRRDQVLQPVEKSLARVLKRLASDEQNEILDRLRRVKRGRPDPEEILPSTDHDHFVRALSGDFVEAAALGASFWSELAGSEASAAVDPSAVQEALETRVSEFVGLHRAHLGRTFAEAEEADLDAGELADRVRATYRDWRSGSLSDFAGDLVTAGFALGERRAAGPGTPWRWVVDNGGLPCADGEDNALAGPVPCEEPFPTGDVTPPAHPGCRCLLAPAHS